MEQATFLGQLVFLFHLIGFGMIVTLLLSGPILERKFKRAQTLEAKLALQKALKSVGLLYPMAVILLLLTGMGNMYYRELGLFKAGWLTAKIIFFAILVVNGAMAGARAGKRGRLIEQLARGETPPKALSEMQHYNKQQSIFYVTQTVLVLIVLALAVFKPE